jgi:hypothetical protein
MYLNPLAKNVTEISMGSGLRILFSYQTPVAVFVPHEGYYRTMVKYSVTTTRHINKWLDGAKAKEVTQEFINARAECN